MLRCFPDPYPDELLYSICARFSHHMRYPAPHSVIIDLYGRKGFIAVTDLPSHLACLASHIPQKDYYTVETLIDNHTLLPFYSPFVSDLSKLERIRQCMEGDKSTMISVLIGRLTCGVSLQEWLRFCPLCVEDDRRELGECYWHRSHQIPGVDVCIKHYVYLQNSIIHKKKAKPNYAFFSLEQVVKVQAPISLNLSNTLDTILLQLAHSASWLMQTQRLYVTNLGWRYNEAIFDLGLLYIEDDLYKLDETKLLEEFKRRYDDATLKYFCVGYGEEFGKTWPIEFIKSTNLFHPVYHLLFISFLGYQIQDFFALVFKHKAN